jgi:hypothetical protein
MIQFLNQPKGTNRIMNDETLSKKDVRGSRNIRNKTVKKNQRQKFDDEQDINTRKAAGKRSHSMQYHDGYDEVNCEEGYSDNPYSDFVDPRLIK